MASLSLPGRSAAGFLAPGALSEGISSTASGVADLAFFGGSTFIERKAKS